MHYCSHQYIILKDSKLFYELILNFNMKKNLKKKLSPIGVGDLRVKKFRTMLSTLLYFPFVFNQNQWIRIIKITGQVKEIYKRKNF